MAVNVTPPAFHDCARLRTGVELVSVEGGTHTWFATGLGPANGAVDATRAIWEFFAGNQRRN